ncbi:PC4-domain-containing protein [Hypomontagnella submonticulosa]|nr:PC4-domain-containing protein [Hypomontagnella submonticulosa]
MGRTKNLKRSRRDDDGDEEEEHALSDQGAKSSSKSNSNKKAKTSGDSGKDGDGNPFWALGGNRRATVTVFNKKTFVNIREYYTDNSGELKPGKKGISLPFDQYIKLLEVLPFINDELREKGHDLPETSLSVPVQDALEAPEAETGPAKSKAKSEAKKSKANIEATSDEDEESN